MTDPKLQWSKFSPDRSEQYVVREDDEKEFDRLVLKYKSVIPQGKAFPDDTGDHATPQAKVQAGVPMCPKHNKPMTNGKYGWYCQSKDPDEPKGWCRQKPPVEFAR